MSNVDHAQSASSAVGAPADHRTVAKALKQADLFDKASRSTIEILAESAVFETIAAGGALASQGEPANALLVLARGRARVERSSGDNRVPLGYRGPGDVIGEGCIIPGATHSENAIAMEAVELWSIEASVVRRLFASDPALASATLALVIARKREAEDRIESMLFRNVEGRLVEFLLAAADRWGVAVPKGTLIAAPITHLEIAQSIGSTRETVTVTLGLLRKAGLLDVAGRRLIITQRSALAAKR